MEGGIPMINCLLQHTLRNLCACSDSSSTPSKWAYAVFWRILPRNYPPPKWDHGGGLLDRAKGNKRNWILVWEDGFCDFCECERVGNRCGKRRFGADTFFKMTHEVYNFGEGLVGKVASDNTHKWVFRDSPIEHDLSSWNLSIDHQPRAWEAQFSSGIETIAIISVREGAIQLGSFDKVVEDLNMVLSIRRKFSYLQSIPGIYTMQIPYLPIESTNYFDYNNGQKLIQTNETYSGIDDKHKMVGLKRQNYEQSNDLLPAKSVYLGYNSPQNSNNSGSGALPLWSIPPLLPSMPCNPGSIFSKILYDDALEVVDLDNNTLVNSQNSNCGDDCVVAFGEIPAVDVKVEIIPGVQEESLNQTIRLEDGVIALGFVPRRGEEIVL